MEFIRKPKTWISSATNIEIEINEMMEMTFFLVVFKRLQKTRRPCKNNMELHPKSVIQSISWVRKRLLNTRLERQRRQDSDTGHDRGFKQKKLSNRVQFDTK